MKSPRRKVLRALIEFRVPRCKDQHSFPWLLCSLIPPSSMGLAGRHSSTDTPQLFDLVGSQNRAQRLLAYLGDVAVNGSSIKGQIGEPKLRTEIIPPQLVRSDGTAVDTSEPCQKGWRNIIVEKGPKAFAQAVRNYKGCLFDGHNLERCPSVFAGHPGPDC